MNFLPKVNACTIKDHFTNASTESPGDKLFLKQNRNYRNK
jgi:hypothetical protein